MREDHNMAQLIPYLKDTHTDRFTLEALSHRIDANELLLEYILRGPIENIRFPKVSLQEARRDELWKQTCFEAFLSESLETSSPYREINCSPNGDWNAYSFSSYRQDMSRTNDTQVVLVHREISDNEALFRVQVQSEFLLSAKYLGITAVIEFSDGSKSYFALKHTGSQADFHRQDSFVISL